MEQIINKCIRTSQSMIAPQRDLKVEEMPEKKTRRLSRGGCS